MSKPIVKSWFAVPVMSENNKNGWYHDLHDEITTLEGKHDKKSCQACIGFFKEHTDLK